MNEYLGSARVVETSSMEEARDAVIRIYLRHELNGSNRLDMKLNVVTDRHMTLGYLTCQTAMEPVMPPTEESYLVRGAARRTTAARGGMTTVRRRTDDGEERR